MVKSHVVSISPATHADLHRHGGSDPLTGDVRIDRVPNTRSDVTVSRALNTTYQNTTVLPMTIYAVATATAGCQLNGLADAATPPTEIVDGHYMMQIGVIEAVTFIVLPNHYYRVTATNANLTGWYELY